jgi:hypothetical protein
VGHSRLALEIDVPSESDSPDSQKRNLALPTPRGVDFDNLYPAVIRLIGIGLPWLIFALIAAMRLAVGKEWIKIFVQLSSFATLGVTAVFLGSVNSKFQATMIRLCDMDIFEAKIGTRRRRPLASRRLTRQVAEVVDLGPTGHDHSREFRTFLASVPRALDFGSGFGAIIFLLLINGSIDGRMRIWNLGWLITKKIPLMPDYLSPTLYFVRHAYFFLVSEIIIIALLGTLVGRMAVMAVTLYQLGRRFEFDVRPWHPDRSGGLKLLGDLCFAFAVPQVIGSLSLAVWNFMPTRITQHISEYNDLKLSLNWFLVITIVLAIGTFLLPLYEIHRAMICKKAMLERRLDALSHEMDEGMNQLFQGESSFDPGRLEEADRRLTFLEGAYKRNSRLFTWPFDRATVGKLVMFQIPPMLSLLLAIVRSKT